MRFLDVWVIERILCLNCGRTPSLVHSDLRIMVINMSDTEIKSSFVSGEFYNVVSRNTVIVLFWEADVVC